NRWLAYEEWMVRNDAYEVAIASDYDVLNQGFTPKDWQKGFTNDSYCRLHYDQVPSLVSANYLGFVQIRGWISMQALQCKAYPNSWKRYPPNLHTSDMILLLDHPQLCPFEPIHHRNGLIPTTNFGEEDWWQS